MIWLKRKSSTPEPPCSSGDGHRQQALARPPSRRPRAATIPSRSHCLVVRDDLLGDEAAHALAVVLVLGLEDVAAHGSSGFVAGLVAGAVGVRGRRPRLLGERGDRERAAGGLLEHLGGLLDRARVELDEQVDDDACRRRACGSGRG